MRKVWNENASARFREMIYKAKRKALENASKELGIEPSVLDMIGRGPDWMHTHIWDELVEKHWSGENCKEKCKIAQKNRMTEKDGSITKHTGGSIPQGAHKLRMEKDLGREVGELELFHRTHRRNKGIGEFVDNKSKKVNALEESRKREEDSQRRTLELEEMVRKLIQEVGYTNRRFAGDLVIRCNKILVEIVEMM
ncbi:UNVERIFIED_CONTAM: hypothetical protein Sradi_0013200 [Sesamum radiatum]|uniref:Uncharacterized protein n=1 Tax=Sesamum radiatum TaxID=300843 RepID=A0AAW2WGJ5_SESRA